jgi:hypothetical protein
MAGHAILCLGEVSVGQSGTAGEGEANSGGDQDLVHFMLLEGLKRLFFRR